MNEEWGFFYLEESFCAQVERFSKPVTNRKDQDLFKVKIKPPEVISGGFIFPFFTK